MKCESQLNMPNEHRSAFPFLQPDNPSVSEGFVGYGLTKRELIAAIALQGLATDSETLLGNNALIDKVGTVGIDKYLANKAVRLADALLEELSRTKK